MTTDAVVIGSGPNGLAAAITLAEAGRAVTVLERASRLGGAVATDELTVPGFRHDTFSSVYPAAAASPVFARWPLERHGLRWVHPRYCYAHPLPEGRVAVLARDLEETAASLDALHAGDGEAWRRFVSPYVEHFSAWRQTMLSGFPPLAGPLKLLAALRLNGMLEWARLLLMPAHALAHELFGADGSRAWLYGAAIHGDVPPAGAGSAIAATHLNVMGHAVGWPSPEGGAARLTDALAGYLAALGGQTRTQTPVRRIAAERGRVVGVELENGERVPARIVIADLTPHALLALAGDALERRYANALGRYRYGPATLKLDWALSGPVPWTAPEAREAGTVHVGGTEHEMLDSPAPTATELPERPLLLFGQQSIADPTRAPAGRHTAWAYTHGHQHADWERETDRHVDRVEAQIERFAPGFRDLIIARHVQSPADMQQRNPNLVAGDVGTGSYTLDQVIFRPLPTLTPYPAPIPAASTTRRLNVEQPSTAPSTEGVRWIDAEHTPAVLCGRVTTDRRRRLLRHGRGGVNERRAGALPPRPKRACRARRRDARDRDRCARRKGVPEPPLRFASATIVVCCQARAGRSVSR